MRSRRPSALPSAQGALIHNVQLRAQLQGLIEPQQASVTNRSLHVHSSDATEQLLAKLDRLRGAQQAPRLREQPKATEGVGEPGVWQL